MREFILGALLGASAAGVGSGGAAAGGLVAGHLTSQPIGHYEFCQSHPAECSIRTTDTRPEPLSNPIWEKIEQVNVAVNKAVKPMNDYDIYGKDEVWAYPDKGVGDCEDYVLEKRRELSAAGIPLTDLLITVVRKRDGEGHAVLTFRTDRGDFILDNLTDKVKRWDETNYRFLKRQASFDTGRWVSLLDERNVLVGSVNK